MIRLRKSCQHGAFDNMCWAECNGGRAPKVDEVVEWLLNFGNTERAARMFALQSGDDEKGLPDRWPTEDYYDEQIRDDMHHAVKQILLALGEKDG